uniref:F-box domain-containing protein n=1 Tax=Steinernema glaseri TaxID=37863 RepID=A0A1I7ZXY7_9BILA
MPQSITKQTCDATEPNLCNLQSPIARDPSSLSAHSRMDSVPVVFLDALCDAMKKTDLWNLLELQAPWSSTVNTLFSRRREFAVFLSANHEGTEVGIRFAQDFFSRLAVGQFGVWSRYHRIRRVLIGYDEFECANGTKVIQQEFFRTKIVSALNSIADAYSVDVNTILPENLPASVFSSLYGRAEQIKTGYAGAECIDFIERQIALGHLKVLELRGGADWPDTINASLKAFLKSPNFESLDISETNLTVDLDMLISVVNSFLKGTIRRSTAVGDVLCGKPAKGEMKKLHRAIISGDVLPPFDGLREHAAVYRLGSVGWTWIDPKKKSSRLNVHFTNDYVQIS